MCYICYKWVRQKISLFYNVLLYSIPNKIILRSRSVFFRFPLSLFPLFSPALSMSLLVHYVCFYFSARHVFLLFSFYLIISIHSSSPSILFNNEDEIVITLILFFDALKYRMFEMLFCFSNRILYSERRRDRLRDVFIKKWCL